MIGHPRFGFNENVNRPSLNEIDQLKNIGTPTIVDAQNRTGSMNPKIKPLKTGDSILGTAITVDLPAEDNLMLYKALQLAHPGDVLVVNTNNNFTRAIWGELMTLSAMELKLGGLVVDGLVRDKQANAQHSFPIFCRGTASVSVEKNGPGFVNGDISCGGVVVRPGDVIVGDDDGVVVVKKENLSYVISNISKIEERERIRKQEIAEGKALPSWLNEQLQKNGLI